MQKLRTEKGITLIALIITIIVMLILVGVTVSVSLNGGLFTTAKQATNKTQLELDKEQLLELALGAMDKDGNVDSDEITKYETFTYADGVYTSESGNQFTVSKWGSVALAPVYELSGKWRFVDDPELWIGAELGGDEISQDISFTAYGKILYRDEEFGEEWFVFGNTNYTKITARAANPYQELDVDTIKFDDDMPYSALEGWLQGDEGQARNEVDFGSNPQQVSKEFYDWFTVNANPVEE